MSDRVALQHAGWGIEVLSRSGGLARCVYRGQEIFRSTPREPFVTGPVQDLCYYPLVPFANRIMNGCFTFDGRAVRLEPNVLGHPHPLHGHGWQAEWHVLERAAASCSLYFEHDSSDGWPWRYRATETLSLSEDVLTIQLAVENRSSSVMPAGLGFHPFFPRAPSARLRAKVNGLSEAGALKFPRASFDVPPAFDFSRARPVRDASGLDHCYSGWSGAAKLEWSDVRWRVQLEAPALAFLHLYVPADRDFFCVEPVSHPLDAFNYSGTKRHAALGLAAGASRQATLAIRCEAWDRHTSATPR